MYGPLEKQGSGEKTFFEKLQDHYFDFCDWVEGKGIPIYKWFVNPLEDRGVPSLAVLILLLLFLLLGVGWLVFNPLGGSSGGTDVSGTYSLSVAVSTELGPLDGASVSIYQDTKSIATRSTSHGVAVFNSLKAGEYTVSVSKDGFNEDSRSVSIPKQNYLSFSLKATSTGGGGGGSGGSGGGGGGLGFSDVKDQTLNIFVKDDKGKPLVASAFVYDRASNVKIGTVKIKAGFGSMQGLQAGQVVYVDAAADGFEPYYGANNTITISSKGANVANIVLVPYTQQQLSEMKNTLVTVLDVNNTPVSNVYMQAFRAGSNTSIPMQNYLTNSTGQLAMLLNSSGDPFYKVLASKTGFDDAESRPFKAGDMVIVPLRRPGDYNETERQNSTNLTVYVTSGGSAVSGASVTVFGNGMLPRNGVTNSRGKVNFFLLNQRHNPVQINASKGILVGSEQLVLSDMVMETELQLSRQVALVSVQAVDYFTGQPVPDALFSALNDSGLVDSCGVNGTGSCVLHLQMGLSFPINASAPGFIDDVENILINSPSMSVTFRLANASLVGDSLIKDFRVIDPSTGEEVNVLYPGRLYSTVFQLLANTSSSADKAGFYVGIEPNKAVLRSMTPPGQFLVGSSSSSCNPSNLDWRSFNAAWIDGEYDGSGSFFSKTVTVNFTVNSLNGIDEIPFQMRYRSYLIKDNKYYRNPFDPNLGTAPDNGALRSGCNAATTKKNLTINGVGIACSDFACIRVYYTQAGGGQVKDNFTALIYDNVTLTPPMVLTYEITLRSDVRTLQDPLLLSFNAPGSALGLLSVTYPGHPDSQGTPPFPPNEELIVDNLTNSLEISLDHLKQYSNMQAGFTFGGQYQIEPLAVTQNSKLFLKIYSGQSGTTLNSTYNVACQSQGCGQGNYGNSAVMSLALAQRKEDGSYITDGQSLYAIGLCTFDSVRNTYLQIGLPKCPGSFVEFNYMINVNDTRDGHGFVQFNSPDGGFTNITNLTVFRTRNGQLSQVPGLDGRKFYGSFSLNLSDVQAGDVLNLSFLSLTTEFPGSYTPIFIFNNGLRNQLAQGLRLNALPGSGNGNATFDYFPCGKASVNLDLLAQQGGSFNFSSSCNDVILQVDPIMPLDAVPMEFGQNFGQRCGVLLAQMLAPTDGSRDLSTSIVFDQANGLSGTAWIAFNAVTAGLYKGNDFNTDPRFPGLDYLGKSILRLSCSRFPDQVISIALTARRADSRLPALDGSYIYYEGQPRELMYSLYNGQVAQDIMVTPSNEPTSVPYRIRSYSPASRVNYFMINHNSVPVTVGFKSVPNANNITISEFNNRFGSAYAHMIAISHLDQTTFNKYNYFLSEVAKYPPAVPNGIWNSTCSAIDYVSEVTHQIPRNFVEEAKRTALITSFRRQPPDQGYWCGHRRDKPQGEVTCYPTILNWLQPGINETKQTIQCPAPACVRATELDPESYSTSQISLGVSPQTQFPQNGQSYASVITDSLDVSADLGGLQGADQLTSVAIEYKIQSNQACQILGGSWCSATFLNGDAALSQQGNSANWEASYSGLTFQQNGEYVIRVKASNATDAFYSPWVRVIVQNNAAACFGVNTVREGVPLCAEPTCDPFCRADGTKEIVTNAGPDFEHINDWWLNDTALQFLPSQHYEGIEKYYGMPFKYFSQKGALGSAFSLSIPLVQWDWHIQDIGAAGYVIENNMMCSLGTGFYELKAASANGVDWAFKAELKQLPLSGYLLNTEPSDSNNARNGYVDEISASPRSEIIAKGYGCGIGADPNTGDSKYLCNSKNVFVEQHTHFTSGSEPHLLDCYTSCAYNNCGYCINFNLPFVQADWQACLPPDKRDVFTSFDALRQASTNPNLPENLRWAYGVGQELGGCPNEAVRISN